MPRGDAILTVDAMESSRVLIPPRRDSLAMLATNCSGSPFALLFCGSRSHPTFGQPMQLQNSGEFRLRQRRSEKTVPNFDAEF